MLDQLEIIELNDQLQDADPKEILNQLVALLPVSYTHLTLPTIA